jgi:hypothetical protein
VVHLKKSVLPYKTIQATRNRFAGPSGIGFSMNVKSGNTDSESTENVPVQDGILILIAHILF